MLTKQAMVDAVNALSKDTVINVYSGRPGCCCGCRGNHFHNTKFPDTDVYDHTVFNDRQVARVINVIKRAAIAVTDEDLKAFDLGGTYVAWQNDTRVYIAYTG